MLIVLSFDRPDGHALDEVLLKNHEKSRYGDHGHDDGSHGRRVIRSLLGKERLHGHGQGLEPGAADEEARHEVVVPYLESLQDHEGGEGGLEQGHDDAPIDAIDRASVQPRRFLELHGYGSREARHDEDAEGHPGRYVHQDDPVGCIGEMEGEADDVDRQEEGLIGDQDADDEVDVGELEEAALVPGYRPGRGAGEHSHYRDGRDRVDDRVQEGAAHGEPIDRASVVVPARRLRQGEGAAEIELSLVLEGIVYHYQHGQEEEGRGDCHQRLEAEGPRRIPLFDEALVLSLFHSCISRRRRTESWTTAIARSTRMSVIGQGRSDLYCPSGNGSVVDR